MGINNKEVIFNWYHPDIAEQIKNLMLDKEVELTVGYDHIDLLAYQLYGDYDYWIPLAIYNDVVNPFDLVDQGFTSIKLFNKDDYNNLLRKLYNNA